MENADCVVLVTDENAPLTDEDRQLIENADERYIIVSNKTDLPGHYGLRHRAAIGVSENNDCVVLVVSEETGAISMVKDGAITTLQPSTLNEKLNIELKI